MRPQHAAAAGGGGALAVDAGPLDLLTSPAGREQRLAAVELLERVRADVDRSGTEAADTLRDAMAGAPEPVPAWQHAMNFLVAPPWDLNQERRDWAAGGGVGILDTVVMATNPLPVALWVGATSKPQVNAFEQRLGIDPRSGFHTAGAVVVPSVLAGTGAIGGAPARVGITLNELEIEGPGEHQSVQRNAMPLLTASLRSAKTLGVAPFAPTSTCPLSTACRYPRHWRHVCEHHD